jgi:uncharacterized protein YbaR (Trm112 family)
MNVIHHSYCPRCQTYLVYTTKNKILCPSCRLAFNKEIFGILNDEYILSDQEISGILDFLKNRRNAQKLKT